MPPENSSAAPVVPSPEHHGPNKLVQALIALIVVALMIWGAWYVFVSKNPHAATGTSTKLLVYEASLTKPAAPATYEFDGKNLTSFSSTLGSIIETAGNGAGVTAAIIATSGGSDVVLLGSAPKLLTHDGGVKAGLAVSGNGSEVAYAVKSGSKAAPWQIVTVSIATGDAKILGEGFAPQFVDPTDASKVLFMRADGVYLDQNGSIQKVYSMKTAQANGAVRVSTDGKYAVLFDPTTGHYAVFSLYRISPLGIKPIAEIKDQLQYFTLAGDSLYELRPNTQSKQIELYQYSLAAPDTGSLVYTFPKGQFAIGISAE